MRENAHKAISMLTEVPAGEFAGLRGVNQLRTEFSRIIILLLGLFALISFRFCLRVILISLPMSVLFCLFTIDGDHAEELRNFACRNMALHVSVCMRL